MAIFRQGVECRWDRNKSRFRLISGYWPMTAACVRSSIDSRRCSNVRSYGARLFTACTETARIMQWICRREENRIYFCSGKSEAEVTSNRWWLRYTHCTIKATCNYTDRNGTSRGLSATAGLRRKLWILLILITLSCGQENFTMVLWCE